MLNDISQIYNIFVYLLFYDMLAVVVDLKLVLHQNIINDKICIRQYLKRGVMGLGLNSVSVILDM